MSVLAKNITLTAMLLASSISYAEEFEPSVDVSGLIFAGYGLDLSDGE